MKSRVLRDFMQGDHIENGGIRGVVTGILSQQQSYEIYRSMHVDGSYASRAPIPGPKVSGDPDRRIVSVSNYDSARTQKQRMSDFVDLEGLPVPTSWFLLGAAFSHVLSHTKKLFQEWCAECWSLFPRSYVDCRSINHPVYNPPRPSQTQFSQLLADIQRSYAVARGTFVPTAILEIFFPTAWRG